VAMGTSRVKDEGKTGEGIDQKRPATVRRRSDPTLYARHALTVAVGRKQSLGRDDAVPVQHSLKVVGIGSVAIIRSSWSWHALARQRSHLSIEAYSP